MNPLKALQEFVRVTKTGGTIHIVIPIEKNKKKRQVRYGHSYVFEDSKQFTDMISHLPLEMVLSRMEEKTLSGIASSFILKVGNTS